MNGADSMPHEMEKWNIMSDKYNIISAAYCLQIRLVITSEISIQHHDMTMSDTKLMTGCLLSILNAVSQQAGQHDNNTQDR